MHWTRLLPELRVAGLGICLALTIACRQPPRHSVGLWVKTAADTCDCPDRGRTIVLHISNNGAISLNAEGLDEHLLSRTFSNIYSTRAEKILYLSADEDVPFQEVADIIDIARNAPFTATMPPVPIPRELQSQPSRLGIKLMLLTPGAVSMPCEKGCSNWGRDGVPLMPRRFPR